MDILIWISTLMKTDPGHKTRDIADVLHVSNMRVVWHLKTRVYMSSYSCSGVLIFNGKNNEPNFFLQFYWKERILGKTKWITLNHFECSSAAEKALHVEGLVKNIFIRSSFRKKKSDVEFSRIKVGLAVLAWPGTFGLLL